MEAGLCHPRVSGTWWGGRSGAEAPGSGLGLQPGCRGTPGGPWASVWLTPLFSEPRTEDPVFLVVTVLMCSHGSCFLI